MKRMISLSLCLLFLVSACRKNDNLKFELMRSFNNLIHSVKELNEEGLAISVYFPGVSNYKEHVKQVLLKYIEQTNDPDQAITFDEQGVVLSRFLGLSYHRYHVLSYGLSEDGNQATMRVVVNFSYDKNITYSNYPDGTQVLIPAKPWGETYTLTIGGIGNPVPRDQLKKLEIDIEFKKTNYEGFWQVRQCVVDPASIEFETSYQDF